MAELASGAAGTLRGEVGRAGAIANDARVLAEEWSEIATAAMRRGAQDTGTDTGPPAQPDSGPADGLEDSSDSADDEPAPEGGGGQVGDGGGGPAPEGGGGSAADEPRPDPVFDWAGMPELEFSPKGVRSTPVWPNEDAS
jgi:hypothetical protein